MKLLNRILAATDFSAAGRRAVTRAALLAQRHEADLHLLHATPDWKLFSRWTSARQQHYAAVNQHAQRALRDEVNRILSAYGVHAHGEIQRGRASEAINRAVASHQPDLVVLGARGEHEPRIAPAALGGTALKILLRADRPLLLVREDRALPYRTSIAAVHAPSEVAKRLILWGSALVPGGDCHVVHAFDAPYCERLRLSGIDTASMDACVQNTEAIARQGFDKLLLSAAPGAHIHLHLVRGNPLGVLVTESARHAPQLVTIGRHDNDTGDANRHSGGTLGLRMSYHTPVDVLVVP
jgi:nucleotide-binding universal stress UspA family protein